MMGCDICVELTQLQALNLSTQEALQPLRAC